jgi:P-type Mg2+ transporter
MTIAGDGVDPELIGLPRRWNMRSIRNFMLVFGSISSVFDYLTFGLLYLLLRLAPGGFRTGWFVESLLTELCIVFVVRTRRPMWRSRPATALWVSSLVVTVVGLALPYSPLAAVFGFVPLPLPIMLMLVGVVLAYTLVSELGKTWFFARSE